MLRLLWWSWQIRIVEPPQMKKQLENNEPFLLAHWHGDEVALLHLVKKYRLATITSTSNDGELVTKVIRKLGGVSSRGSSTRGGVGALKGLIRLIKNNRFNAAVAVDGPKGPIHKVKPGIFEVSRLAQIPIYWVGVSSNRFHIFEKAWNKAMLPLPFAKVHIEWHGPIPPLSKDDDPKSIQLSEELEHKLNTAKLLASKQI